MLLFGAGFAVEAFALCGGEGGLEGSYLCEKGEEGAILRGEGQAFIRGEDGGGEVLERYLGEGGAIVGFYVNGVEAEGRGAVEDCGAVVFCESRSSGSM